MKKFISKAILNSDKASAAKVDWSAAKHSVLEFGENHLRAAGFKIDYSAIESSTLELARSRFLAPKCVLTIEMTDGVIHHFSLRYSSFFKGDLPFAVKRKGIAVKSLWPKRILVFIALGYVIWRIVKGLL